MDDDGRRWLQTAARAQGNRLIELGDEDEFTEVMHPSSIDLA